MKHKKLIKKIAIIACLIYTMFLGNISFAGTLSSDINGIDETKYPGVKSEIRRLQSQNPNYTFHVYYTGIDWTEAITMEYQGHGSSPKNLFQLKNNYKGKWYCPICGEKTYDTGWYCASIDAIAYMMDPRNSLDGTSVYQFKSLETPDASAENIQTVINSKYSTYSYINNPTAINAIVNASATYNFNGYSILAKIVNEQGKGTSPLATGKGHKGQYAGYYNFFNVGAYGNGTDTVLINGLKYAQNKGWNSIEKSIMGGSEYYKSSYIGRGQNTLYYQRFNVVHENSLFSHQYQQDIMGAQTSAQLMKNYYTTTNTLGTVNHTFVIPLYENMPKTAAARPSTTENPDLDYETATVLSDKIAVKASPNSARIVSYLNQNETVKVLKRADKPSADGQYWDTVVTETDGTYGYVERSAISKITVSLPNYIFDAKYYADNNADLKKAFGYNEYKLISHFTKYGMKEGRKSSPTFDAKYYLQNNADLKAAFGNDYQAAAKHFEQCGHKELRKSSEQYDGRFYKYYYADLTNLSSEALVNHYIKDGIKEGRIAGLDAATESVVFDLNVYLERNPDIKAAFGNNQLLIKEHWIKYGIKEGRTSSVVFDLHLYGVLNTSVCDSFGQNYRAWFEYFIKEGINKPYIGSLIFDLSAYLEFNPDVKAKFGTNYKQAYAHFANTGIKEGLKASEVFDSKIYFETNGDLKKAFGNNYKKGIMHFMQYGINEMRNTSTTFSLKTYATYNDLKRAFANNYKEYYIHYLRFGKAEGRKGI